MEISNILRQVFKSTRQLGDWSRPIFGQQLIWKPSQLEGSQPSWTSQGKIDYIYDRDESSTYAYIHSRKESYHGLYQEIELNQSHNGATLSASFRMKIDNSNIEIKFWDPYLFKNFRAQASFRFDYMELIRETLWKLFVDQARVWKSTYWLCGVRIDMCR